MPKRLLRTYQRIAQVIHKEYCERCDLPIFPGDHYIAYVYVCSGRLWVEKFHFDCPVDPDEDQKEREGFYSSPHQSAVRRAA